MFFAKHGINQGIFSQEGERVREKHGDWNENELLGERERKRDSGTLSK